MNMGIPLPARFFDQRLGLHAPREHLKCALVRALLLRALGLGLRSPQLQLLLALLRPRR